ncbi:MAG: DUF3098 domain-containing protein [Bacteroidales bacterium]|nr:DUF3098 domain-containing protein [Bacteroidales bacterium]
MAKKTVPEGVTLKQDVSQVKKLKDSKSKVDFVFNREKYILMLIGLGLIFIGFMLMIGGGTDNPNEFSNELFSFRRITLAPIIVLLGYGLEIYAIMKLPKKVKQSETEE